MAKCKLEFNLPEEEKDLNFALNGLKWALVCWDMEQTIRQYLKYGHKFKTPNEAIENIREKLYTSINNYNISFEDID